MLEGTKTSLCCAACCAGWLLLACGDSDGAADDAMDDAGRMGEADAGPMDSEDAATPDAADGVDAGLDATTADAGSDGGQDAAADAAVDASGDSLVDAGDTEPDASPTSTAQELEDVVDRPPPEVTQEVPMEDPVMTATVAGSGALATDTAQSADDEDELWMLTLDIDEDGSEETVTVLFDDEAQIQYTWWEGMLLGFCLDGSDAAVLNMLVYDLANERGRLLWESDCAGDEGIVFGCNLTADGALQSCGSCSFDEGWTCEEDGTIVVGELTDYTCSCDVSCDTTSWDLDFALCGLTADESVDETSQQECELEFEADGCAELTCDCSCDEGVDEGVCD